MTEKRFSIKVNSSIGLSSIYTDNGKVMTQLEVLDVLIKQDETIHTITKENEHLKAHFKKMENLFQATNKENDQLKNEIKYLRLRVLDSIYEADEIQCSCNPCVVEECVKKVVE